MKGTIDNLVSSIRYDIEQPSSSIPELNAFREMAGLDGLARAKTKMDILYRWSEEPSLKLDLRDYITQQIATLPVL